MTLELREYVHSLSLPVLPVYVFHGDSQEIAGILAYNIKVIFSEQKTF